MSSAFMNARCSGLIGGIIKTGYVKTASIISLALKRSVPLPLLAPRTFVTGNSIDNETAAEPGRRRSRDAPRIQLSRHQIHRLWEDLGTIDPETSQMSQDSWNSSTGSQMSTSNDRIAINPDSFPLELFENQRTPVKTSQDNGIDPSIQIFDNLDLEGKRLALENEIVWHLREATRCNDDDGAQLAEKASRILERWHERAQDDKFQFPTPSWYAHESVVRGWTRIGMSTDEHEIKAMKRADDALTLLLNLVDDYELEVQGSFDRLFTSVIRLWLRAPYVMDNSETPDVEKLSLKLEYASRASELLLEKERRSEANDECSSHKRPKQFAYSTVLNQFNHVSTTASKMNTVTDDDRYFALAETAARKSEELLTWMEHQSQLPGIDFPSPDVYSYRAVLSSWANVQSQEGVEKANEILLRMEEAKHLCEDESAPYRRVMIHVYSVMSPLEDYRAADATSPANKAVSLLARMDPMLETLIRGDSGKEDKETEDYVGETVCYGAVIQALANAKVGEGEKMLVTPAILAEIILNRMEILNDLGKLNKDPSFHIYGNVVRAFIRWSSQSSGKVHLAPKVERVLNLIETKVFQQEQISAEIQRDIISWFAESVQIVSQPTFGGSPSRAAELKEQMENIQNEMSKKGTS